ncbi:hypothetical protein U91I_04001 [alpha proteobacterium U9-1i]|nr:hypothetical protein U91I_04001 [alpha proteobacterium U9-1i]
MKTRADSPALKRAAIAVEASAWNALGFLNFTRAHFQYYDELLERFADYQICLVDEETGYPVAVGCCVPFYCADPSALPPEGWDWIVESASRTDVTPNMLGGLGISVPQVHRSKGLARVVISAMRDMAVSRGLGGVVIPVRPTAKAKHPEVSMDEYMAWTDDKGRTYDPWLRSHLAAGGRVVGHASRSMVVEEPVAFWETWGGQRFEQSGLYAIPGGLTQVKIDLERGTGHYVEPNVWFAYAA